MIFFLLQVLTEEDYFREGWGTVRMAAAAGASAQPSSTQVLKLNVNCRQQKITKITEETLLNTGFEIDYNKK